MMKIETDHLVIGAGLAGCGIALELAKRGERSVLLEQDHTPMNRASLRNEGKIHLGLIYAADTSGQTGVLQLKGALSFYPILESWIGHKINEIELSTPFVYLVAKDSLLTADQLDVHYQSLQRYYLTLLEDNAELNYLGSTPEELTQRLNLEDLKHYFNMAKFSAAFQTAERAVNTDHLANEISNAVKDHPNIQLITCAKASQLSVFETYHDVKVDSTRDQQTLSIQAKTVFNTSWDQRLLFDKQAGFELPTGWLHRLKYRVISKIPEQAKGLPSATIVLGAYGDAVIRQETAYMSWYPSGLKGWSHDLMPPESWALACSGHVTDPGAQRLGQEIQRKTVEWYPSLSGSQVVTVDAGSIFAYGNADVDQLSSGLHGRSQIGVAQKGKYFSVDPGKLTTAPMFAVEAVNQALKDSQ